MTSGLSSPDSRRHEHGIEAVLKHYIEAVVHRTVDRKLVDVQMLHTREKKELVRKLDKKMRRCQVSIET
jgi:hypothetical protein